MLLSDSMLFGKSSVGSLLHPPRGFFPVRAEDLQYVHLAKNPHAGSRKRSSAAQRAGLAFEKKAKDFLSSSFPHAVPGQWFYYSDGFRRRYCQPDFLIFDQPLSERPSCLTIVEIKIRWTETAWWQLTHLYAPVVSHFYKPEALRLVCLTKSFDPAIPVAGSTSILDTLDEELPIDNVGVFLWRG